MDPLNYASDDLSIDVFRYGQATQGLDQPIKKYMSLINAALYLFLTQYEFYSPLMREIWCWIL
jgi:hypothetical protein